LKGKNLILTLTRPPRKKDTKSIIGTVGIRTILLGLSAAGHTSIPTVCIGGINGSNATSVLIESSAAPAKSLDGIAVVSALVAAADPAAAARDLLGKVAAGRIPDVIKTVAATTPLSHNMTNLVRRNGIY
jgi:thiamine-phosphate diphosphorylase/hydroxyethylthiazole kinase